MPSSRYCGNVSGVVFVHEGQVHIEKKHFAEISAIFTSAEPNLCTCAKSEMCFTATVILKEILF